VFFPSLIPYGVSATCRRYKRNVQSMRQGIRKIIESRKSGNSQSAFEDGGDLLSILLSSELWAGNIEKTIDELIMMIMAGNETIMVSMTNTIMHLAQDPAVRTRLMDEICPVLDKAAHDFVGALSIEDTDEFEFLRRCWHEAMRMCPPISVPPPQNFSRPVKIKGINYTPDDIFFINVEAIHNDPDEWVTPDQYLPDRFDRKSKLYMRPDGKPRHPFSFAPFAGGKRICLGKTLAETMTVITIPLLVYHFDF
jgi:cytochrome P450